MAEIDWDRAALEAIGHSHEMEELLAEHARVIRNDARTLAGEDSSPGSKKPKGIADLSGDDAISAYADVGFTKHHAGFVLWWAEFGTVNQPPTPHLRAALDRARKG
jgi:glucosamine 6-phosphate synthetase-like amidotransferase/phosphosugar isomerase protein